MKKSARAAMKKTKARKGMVIFDTEFGNTERIANSLASGLKRAGMSMECVGTGQVDVRSLAKLDLLVLGAPTQTFTASKRMRDFLDKLQSAKALSGKRFYAFDTKLPSKFSGSAARYIESKLEGMGMKSAGPSASAIGRGSVFKLDDGEEQKFEEIGFELGSRLLKSK